MAKPLGPKSLLIRDAIKAHPDKGNTELAEMMNASPARKEDKIEVKPNDVAQQKQAMKTIGSAAAEAAPSAPAKKKPGRPKKATAAPAAAPRPAAAHAAAASPVDLIDKTFALAKECGGITALKKLVDRLAQM